MAKSDKNKGYGSKLLAVAPAFGAKAVLGDLPKAAIEKGVASRVTGGKFFREAKASIMGGAASGRAAGGLAGILTAPIFMKGLSMARSKDKKERRKGLAYLAGSGVAYGAGKGLGEGLLDKNLSKAGRLKEGLGLAKIRALKAPLSALILGASLAKAKNVKAKKDSSKTTKLLAPALGGAAAGAINRSIEQGSKLSKGRRLKILTSAKGMKALGKAVLPSTIGGAAAGAFGGLVLDKLTDMAKDRMKK